MRLPPLASLVRLGEACGRAVGNRQLLVCCGGRHLSWLLDTHGSMCAPAELCERCWSANAEERPTFADVTVELENVINNPTVDSSDDDGEEEAKRSCGGADTMSLGSGFASRASRGDGDVAVRIEGLSAISTGTGSLPRRPADPM